MEGAAKPSTSSGSGVTDGASGGASTAAAASMEERFADLCKVRMLTFCGVCSSPLGSGFF
jgi:retinoblastoma-like protein 1